MELIEEKTEENDKHTPVVEEGEIRVGAITHPMEEEHFIEWIEAVTEKGTLKKFLQPGDKPIMKVDGKVKEVRAYCNLHGLWKKVNE